MVFIPELGWFDLKPGDAIALSLQAVVLANESTECASGKFVFEFDDLAPNN